MPRWVDAKKVTFKFGLGDEFIEVLKTLRKLGLDRTEKVRVGHHEVSPRDVVAACLPDPLTLGDKMTGKTCAGLYVTGTGKDGNPRAVYLYHVSDNDWTMQEYGAQAVVWQTAMNPVVALELLSTGAWSGSACWARRRYPANRSSNCSRTATVRNGRWRSAHETLDQICHRSVKSSPRSRTEFQGPCRPAQGRGLLGTGRRGPIYADRAGGGDRRCRRQLLHRPRGRHRRGQRGQQRPKVVEAARRTGAQAHPHLLHGRGLRAIHRGVRAPEPAHPGDYDKHSALFNPAPKRWRTRSRSPAPTPAGTRSWP